MNKFIVILLVCLASTNALQVQSVEAKGIVDLIINTKRKAALRAAFIFVCEMSGLNSLL